MNKQVHTIVIKERNGNMKNKKLIIILIAVIITIIGLTIYFYELNKEYKYICFNMDVYKETLIIESYLEECTSSKRLPKGVITSKEDLIINDVYKSYMQIKDVYKEGEMLYKEDFIVYEHPKATETNIDLLNEVEVMYLGSGYDEPIKYRVYIKKNKLYATNLNTSEESIIFDEEEVASIAVRPVCCTGNGNLLILTADGNVYISEKDCNYAFSFDFPFKKIEATDIVSFKLVPAFEFDFTKNLYGINRNNEEILLQKLN